MSECRVANAIRRQAEKEKNKKREGGELDNPRRTSPPPASEGWINAIKKGPYAKNRLEETSGSTVASESEKSGTTMPLAPRVPATR